MSPSAKELEIIPGNKIRLQEGDLTFGFNPREVFKVIEAPAHGNPGVIILLGLLSKRVIEISPEENVIQEKVE